MTALANPATSSTVGLLITFAGIGVIVHVIIFYIIALVGGEHLENRELLSRSTKRENS